VENGYVYSDDYSDLDSEGASMQLSRESRVDEKI